MIGRRRRDGTNLSQHPSERGGLGALVSRRASGRRARHIVQRPADPPAADWDTGSRESVGEGSREHAPSRPRTLQEAVRWTVLYSTVFAYPLTRDEIFRFVLAPGGSRAEVEEAIDAEVSCGRLETDGCFVYPPGEVATVQTRLQRGRHADRTWKRARHYARLIWMLPYVRMVAVTGALAMNNVEPRDDIDFLIVTEPERLWITRGMILLIARCARMWGDTLCPNYIISSRALRFGRRDPYTAHELAQMTPLHGGEIARRLWQENEWCRDLLPNAQWRDDSIADDRVPPVSMRLKSLGQALLDLPPGTFLERWERRRKIDKLSGDGSGSGEALYTADVCKGHSHGHGARIMDRWTAQIAEGTGPLERASIAPRWM